MTPPKTEPQIKTVADESVGLGTTATPVVAERWWEQYGDPQFDRLVTRALEQNPHLQQTLARLRAPEHECSWPRRSVSPASCLEWPGTTAAACPRNI